jgi:hypothetical protein
MPSSRGRIRPNQAFGALVNGHDGVTAPAVIQMACFGPTFPGETGHPMAGQTVEVVRPVHRTTPSGFTGPDATTIVAFFGVLPPTPIVTPPSTGIVTFSRYGVAQAIPTSLVLPCAGTGNVNFVPLPLIPTSRSAIVPVSFLGQP